MPKGQPTTIAGAYYAGGATRAAMRARLSTAIRSAEGNLALVSRQFGVSYSTLYRWLDADRFNLFEVTRAEFPSVAKDLSAQKRKA